MKNKEVRKLFTMQSQMRTISIKCYDEQLLDGWENTKRRIQSHPKDLLEALGIMHDRDYNADNIWKPSIEKPHYHIIIRFKKNWRPRISQILKQLHICFRKEDENLFRNHGVESCIDFAQMALYLTHDTENAILEGKAPYKIEEIVSNLSLEEIKQIREGYTHLSDKNITISDMAKFDAYARSLGKNFGDFEEWKMNLPYAVRIKSGMKAIKESYDYGVLEGIREKGKIITRLCVYIRGKHDLGKSTILSQITAGRSDVVTISERGTGQYDDLSAQTEYVIVDDQASPDILSMAGENRVNVHKRNGGRPWWCGHYFIVISNLPFEDWVHACGEYEPDRMEAARSRFFICHIEKLDNNYFLFCDKPCERGLQPKVDERLDMFEKFRKEYNYFSSTYKKENTISRSRALGFGSISFSEKDEAGHILRIGVKTAMNYKGSVHVDLDPPEFG